MQLNKVLQEKKFEGLTVSLEASMPIRDSQNWWLQYHASSPLPPKHADTEIEGLFDSLLKIMSA